MSKKLAKNKNVSKFKSQRKIKIKTPMRIAGPLALPNNVDTDVVRPVSPAPGRDTCNNIVRGAGRTASGLSVSGIYRRITRYLDIKSLLKTMC